MDLGILKHLPAHGTVLCMACKEPYCIPPAGIATHLRSFHRSVLSKKQRQELVLYANTLHLLEVSKVRTPSRYDGPVEGLHRMNGLECLCCGYVCHIKNSMEQHCRQHDWVSTKPIMWKEQCIQVLSSIVFF
jgi:hypothetical protein